MTGWVATAPGKVMLTGEYAVLDGGEAVVVAIDRRARARLGEPTAPSEFLAAAAAVLAREVGAEAAAAIGRIHVDTGALRTGAVKLGLGSSAAATVAAVGAALHAAGAFDRARVERIARTAHAEAQARKGAAGSGADVAASARGGAIGFTRERTRALALPPDLRLDFAWTGAAADTATLVAAVTAARANPGVTAALDAIARASAAFAEASTADDALHALTQAGLATAALAAFTAVPLVPPAVAALQRAAAGLGAAVKTTGAGGGDIVVIGSRADADPALVAAAVAAAGLHPLALAVDPAGVDIAAGES